MSSGQTRNLVGISPAQFTQYLRDELALARPLSTLLVSIYEQLPRQSRSRSRELRVAADRWPLIIVNALGTAPAGSVDLLVWRFMDELITGSQGVLALVKDATLGNTILAVAELCRQQCSKPETWWEALNHMDAVGHAARNERGLEARAMDATHKVGDCGWLMAKLKARTSEPVSGADVGYHPRRVDTFESRLDLVLKSLPLTWAASRCYISTEPDNEVMVDAYGHLTNLLIALLAAPPVVSTPAGSSGAADIKPDAADIKPDAADINPDAVTLREPAGPVWYGC